MSANPLPTVFNLCSTLVKKSLQGSRHFASDHLTAEEFQIEMVRELKGQWFDPMHVRLFLKDLLHVPRIQLIQHRWSRM